jgi:Protein of unknown function (DUF1348)
VPSAQVHIVDGGHFSLDTAPDEIAARVREFMDMPKESVQGEEIMATATTPAPPFPPFTRDSAVQKVRLAEDAWNTRITAFLSGVLLTAFALAMTVALGAKAPLNFSVFSAAGGAFLLATSSEFPFSLDNLLRSR